MADRTSAPIRFRPRPRRRWWVIGPATSTLLLVAAGALLWLQPGEPDGFYLPPDDLADAAAGELLRHEPFDVGLDGRARAWRILYRSQDEVGRPLAVSGIVLEPHTRPPGPAMLLSAAHGTTGFDERCAPSLSARPLTSIPGVDAAIARGWTLVASDYPGLGTPGPHPYLIGPTTAYAVLDAARAAEQLLAIEHEHVSVWGFSQGGHAALFAGELAATYAPELPLEAIVAFAPPTELDAVLRAAEGGTLSTMMVANTAVAWSELYEDLSLEDVVTEDSVEAAIDLAGTCLEGPSVSLATIRSVQLRDEVARFGDPGTEGWTRVLERNTPRGPLGVPTLVLHGTLDQIVDPTVVATHVRGRCEAGEPIRLELVPTAEHLTVVWQGTDRATAFTEDRVAGQPLARGC